jgi:tetratricopeptide (TPR) repeat protein
VILKAYNPHELSPETVKSVATGREQPLEHILEIIRRNVDAPSLQHVIVSAPRGYGKSFFLRYVEIILAEIIEDEQLPIAMALLPEELPHVKEPDTLIAEFKRTFTKAPADTVGVRWVEDLGDAWDEAVAELDSAISEKFGDARGLLVAGVENFDLLLRKAFSKTAQAGRLREFLTRRGNRVMLIAASARGAFDRDYNRPLFKAFEEIALEPWTIDQCLDFFRAQRKEAKKPPLTDVQEAKAKAVATYIGGTPRLATMIGEALLEDDPLRAADLLEKLVDELTPYYKERVEVLPPRSQGLLDALLRGGERCSATELARRVGAPNQPTIAAPLDELKKDLVVTGEKAPDSAEVLLRVTDRVFVHYYRKRILSHGQETCPLEALVDLLAVIYSPEEKKREADKLAALGFTREAELMERLWRADQESITLISADDPRLEEISQLKELINAGARASHEGQYLEALALLDDVLLRASKFGSAKLELAVLGMRYYALDALGRHGEALSTAREAIEKASESGDVLSHAKVLQYAARSLNKLDQHEEALKIAREAAINAEKAGHFSERARALNIAAHTLSKLQKYEEAVAGAREAALAAENAGERLEQAAALRTAASALRRIGRHEEAIEVARQSAMICREVDEPHRQASALRLIASIFLELDQYQDALAAAREAAAKSESDSLENIAALTTAAGSLLFMERVNEALDTIRKAKETAQSINDPTLNAVVALAAFTISIKANEFDLALSSYQLLLATRQTLNLANVGPGFIFRLISEAATTQLGWSRLIELIQGNFGGLDEIAGEPDNLRGPGRMIANATTSNRESARKMTSHMVAALAQGIETAPDPPVAHLWTAVLDASASEIATAWADNASTPAVDPTFLKEVADIYAAHPQVPARATALLAAAAAYHERGRDPAALARLDPDLATMLMAVFPPNDESPKRSRKPRAKKKKQE